MPLAAVAAVGLTASASAATISDGSSLGASFVVGAVPGNITFDYNLLTTSHASSPTIGFAYYTVNGTAYLLSSQNRALINTSNFFGGAAFQTAGPTGAANNGTFTISSAPLNASSTNTIGFGVMDVNGGTGGIALCLDNIRMGGTVLSTVGGNDGSFETGGGDLSFGFTSAGNTTLQFVGTVPDLVATDPNSGGNFAILGSAGVNAITGPPPVTTSLSTLSANSQTTNAQIQALADTLDPSAVPLPSSLMVAPLGLAVVGLYAARNRRTIA